MDKEGYILSKEGFSMEEIITLFTTRKGNTIESPQKIISDDKIAFWKQKATVFLPCAGSRLVNKAQIDHLIENGCELISCGANVPFDNPEILYGDVMQYADKKISVIPDFIANCGMARTFAYCMSEDSEITSSAIFEDVATILLNALKDIKLVNPQRVLISETALTLALKKLL